MTAMTVGTHEHGWPPPNREWTVDDLEDLPDDGLQYELFDGMLLVSPAPVPRHQRAVLQLAVLLIEGCPPELEVFVAPLDFQPTRRRSFQPDVLVVRRDRIGARNITHPPVLAVEVLSPSTRSKDLLLKRTAYADAGVPSFWVFDPDEPSLAVHELRDGDYQQVTHGGGDCPVTVDSPYPVTVVASAVVAG